MAKKQADRQAPEKADPLRDAMTRLDALDRRVQKGALSPEDLAQVRREQQEVMDVMPSDVRADYARAQAPRKDENAIAYRAADGFASAPDLYGNLRQVAAPKTAMPPKEPEDGQKGPQQPIYKAVQDYQP